MRSMGEVPNSEDYASIDRAAMKLHRQGWRKRFSLNEVIDAWASLVDEVERGYSMTIDDYTNDLSIRGWPEQARQWLSPRVEQSMDDRLRPLDARFIAATDEVPRRLPGAGDGWWATRLPKVLAAHPGGPGLSTNSPGT